MGSRFPASAWPDPNRRAGGLLIGPRCLTGGRVKREPSTVQAKTKGRLDGPVSGLLRNVGSYYAGGGSGGCGSAAVAALTSSMIGCASLADA